MTAQFGGKSKFEINKIKLHIRCKLINLNLKEKMSQIKLQEHP